MDNFDKSLALVLESEGGWVNNPSDPGGETNLGITKSVYEDWVGHPVESMKGLTKDDVAPIYRAKYWMACYAPQLPMGLDYAVFDGAVNMGVGRSIKLFQQSLGCVPDGFIGKITLGLIEQKNIADLINNLMDEREAFYKGLKNFPAFGKGWLSRVYFVRSNAIQMAKNG